jgi:hypothetical protein
MFRAGAILLFAVATAIQPIPKPSGEHSNQHPVHQATDRQQQSYADKRGTDTSPLVVKMAHTIEGDKQAADTATKESEDARNNTLLMIFNGVLAFVAILELVYIVRQEGWMRESVNAAKDAAGAAKLSADVAVAGQRPWISISAEITGPLTFGERSVELQIKVRVKNVGKSPAMRVTGSTGLAAANRLFRGSQRGEPDAAKTAVNRAQISFSERISYDRGRSSEEIERIKSIGEVLFPDEEHAIRTRDWGVGKEELRGIIFNGDKTPFVAIFCAVSVEYLFGGTWGTTTVIYAVERPEPQRKVGEKPNDDFRFWDSSKPEHTEGVELRKLSIYTTAT